MVDVIAISSQICRSLIYSLTSVQTVLATSTQLSLPFTCMATVSDSCFFPGKCGIWHYLPFFQGHWSTVLHYRRQTDLSNGRLWTEKSRIIAKHPFPPCGYSGIFWLQEYAKFLLSITFLRFYRAHIIVWLNQDFLAGTIPCQLLWFWPRSIIKIWSTMKRSFSRHIF